MVFLNPGFLYGLLAVGIPVIIHLINFSRPKKIRFTRLDFLRSVSESVKQRVRLRDYLVLAARISFIVFLVLALAHPFRPAKSGMGNERSTRPAVWIDNSYSMQTTTAEGTLLSTAMDAARRMTEVYPKQTEFYLLDNDFLSLASKPLTGDLLSDRLTEISYSVASRSPEAAFKRLQSTGEKDKSEYWLISDFQRSSGLNLKELTMGLDSTSPPVNLVMLPASESGNVFVDSVWTAEPFVKKALKNKLIFRIKNSGNRPVEDLNVRLYVEQRQYAAFNVSLSANSEQMLSVDFTPEDDKEQQCRLEFEEEGPDFDNSYYFVLRPSPPVKVCVITEKSTASFSAKALSKEPLFEVSTFGFKSADYEKLKNADAVVLENYNFDDAPLSETLLAWVREGKTLIVFPGAVPVAGDRLLARLGSVLPEAAAKAEMKNPDPASSFFEGVFENDRPHNVQMPEARATLDLRGADVPLIRLKNELTYYAMLREGNGRMYAAASPADAAYTNFHKHSVFLPVIYKSVTSAATGGDAPAFHFNGAGFEVLLPRTYATNVLFRLEGGGSGIVPDQRVIKNRLLLNLPANELKPGFYHLMTGDDTLKTLAFNAATSESYTERLNEPALRELFAGHPAVHLFTYTDAEKWKKDITIAKSGISLRMQCIWAALIFLLIETLIIRFYRQ